MDDFEKELKLGFLEEAEQSIADVELAFLALENDPGNKDHINKIFRLAHNLKGSSKAVGFEQFGQFTHEFESFVLRVKNDELKANNSVISVLLKVTDFIKDMAAGLRSNLDAIFNIDPLLNVMKNYSESGTSAIKSEKVAATVVTNTASKAEKAVSNSSSDKSNNLFSVLSDAMNDGEMAEDEDVEQMDEYQTESPVHSAQTTVLSFPEKPKGPVTAITPENAADIIPNLNSVKMSLAEESIRVAVNKIEKLLNLVGEMVILQSVLSQNANVNDVNQFKKTTDELGKVTKELQDVSMSLRMVPVKPTFQKMQRIVRDTAQMLNKDVLLSLVGEETELDKNILENINDPLVHLIRNSVDHGIETAEKRIEAGKSSQGHVQLKAYHRSGRLVIEVIDDGAGLDAEKLKRIACTKGIIRETDVLSEMECYKLIFAPGFSTKEQVTEVSGRGVGMDVVKTNIEKLGGEIEIDSVMQKGTTFRIILPLTMAIIDGLIVTYNTEKYVIPLSHVHETLRPKPDQIYQEKNMGSVLLLKGENVPMYYLGDFFNQKRHQDETDMIAFVFRSNNRPFAVLVDDILELQQIVVKKLSAGIQGMKGVGGTTILGDGRPSLILEPNDLLLRSITKIEKPLKKINNNINKLNKEDVA